MRHRLCVLPSDPNQGPTPGSLAHPSVVWCVTRLERTQAQVAQPRPRARRTSKRAVRRLRRQVPALRNGLRPSQGGRQVGRRHSNGWPCRARDHPCRSRQVRYRVCELPPSADVSSARERISSGSSSVGGASAFQAECRGFESRLPLQPPFQGLPRRNSANFSMQGNEGHEVVDTEFRIVREPTSVPGHILVARESGHESGPPCGLSAHPREFGQDWQCSVPEPSMKRHASGLGQGS
jgi:hypothetical protein